MKTLPIEHWARYGITSEAEEEQARAFMVAEMHLTQEMARAMMEQPNWPSIFVGPLARVCVENAAEQT